MMEHLQSVQNKVQYELFLSTMGTNRIVLSFSNTEVHKDYGAILLVCTFNAHRMWFQEYKMSHKEMLALSVIIFSTYQKLFQIWVSILIWNVCGECTDHFTFSFVSSMQVFTSMEDMFAIHFVTTFVRMNLRICFDRNLIFFVVLIAEKKIFLEIWCIARGQQKHSLQQI